MSVTQRLTSQNLNHKLNLPEHRIHRSHINLPFNPISGFPATKHTVTSITTTTHRRNWLMIVYANVDPAGPPPPPPPPGSHFGSWKNWIIGILMTFVIPIVTTKGSRIKLLMQKVDQIVDTAEHISDVVEAVADKVDKVVEELGDELPEGSELKKTLDFIENVAERVEKDAHTAGDLIDKNGHRTVATGTFLFANSTRVGSRPIEALHAVKFTFSGTSLFQMNAPLSKLS